MTTKAEKMKNRRPRRPFPKHTLKDALKVAKAIQDKNAGKPWKPIFVAEALGISPTSTNFRDITSSSYKYGLTRGTWNAKHISLTPLGSSITKSVDPQKEMKGRQKAALKVEIFKQIYEHYQDSKFPSSDDTYFKNMLESEFGIPRELVDECIELLLENGRFTNIIRDVRGAPFVVFADVPPETALGRPERETEEVEGPPIPAEMPQLPTPAQPLANQIFIAHGKNTVPLEQLKKILDEFIIPYKVSIDEPHKGRPISKKVADIMRSCTSAIIIFTADEEYIDAENNKTYRPSDNVVYELGAASILYGDKIVILKQEGVGLASDFSDLGYISFEKNKIKAKAMDIIKELVGFGLLKVTPA